MNKQVSVNKKPHRLKDIFLSLQIKRQKIHMRWTEMHHQIEDIFDQYLTIVIFVVKFIAGAKHQNMKESLILFCLNTSLRSRNK